MTAVPRTFVGFGFGAIQEGLFLYEVFRSGKFERHVVDDFSRTLLVEGFNRILITRFDLPGFRRGIEVFIENPDLLQFEEAKLYGHNAVHASIDYLPLRRGYRFMFGAAGDRPFMAITREAFLEESGTALIARYWGLDPLSSPAGYQEYADDLPARMTNPYVRDRTERTIRDPRRKLPWKDRLIGTMRFTLDAGITPGSSPSAPRPRSRHSAPHRARPINCRNYGPRPMSPPTARLN